MGWVLALPCSATVTVALGFTAHAPILSFPEATMSGEEWVSVSSLGESIAIRGFWFSRSQVPLLRRDRCVSECLAIFCFYVWEGVWARGMGPGTGNGLAAAERTGGGLVLAMGSFPNAWGGQSGNGGGAPGTQHPAPSTQRSTNWWCYPSQHIFSPAACVGRLRPGFAFLNLHRGGTNSRVYGKGSNSVALLKLVFFYRAYL